jgi:hypothetical protein
MDLSSGLLNYSLYDSNNNNSTNARGLIGFSSSSSLYPRSLRPKNSLQASPEVSNNSSLANNAFNEYNNNYGPFSPHLTNINGNINNNLNNKSSWDFVIPSMSQLNSPAYSTRSVTRRFNLPNANSTLNSPGLQLSNIANFTPLLGNGDFGSNSNDNSYNPQQISPLNAKSRKVGGEKHKNQLPDELSLDFNDNHRNTFITPQPIQSSRKRKAKGKSMEKEQLQQQGEEDNDDEEEEDEAKNSTNSNSSHKNSFNKGLHDNKIKLEGSAVVSPSANLLQKSMFLLQAAQISNQTAGERPKASKKAKLENCTPPSNSSSLTNHAINNPNANITQQLLALQQLNQGNTNNNAVSNNLLLALAQSNGLSPIQVSSLLNPVSLGNSNHYVPSVAPISAQQSAAMAAMTAAEIQSTLMNELQNFPVNVLEQHLNQSYSSARQVAEALNNLQQRTQSVIHMLDANSQSQIFSLQLTLQMQLSKQLSLQAELIKVIGNKRSNSTGSNNSAVTSTHTTLSQLHPILAQLSTQHNMLESSTASNMSSLVSPSKALMSPTEISAAATNSTQNNSDEEEESGEGLDDKESELHDSSGRLVRVVGNSCHQCKTKRTEFDLVHCTAQHEPEPQLKKSRRRRKIRPCRKKYCERCIGKFYGEINPPKPRPSKNDQNQLVYPPYTCPGCRGICTCAAW